MTIIERIRKKIHDGDYEFTIPHFFEEMAEDEQTFDDIERAIIEGRVRQKFTRDPRGTRYEVVGPAIDGRGGGGGLSFQKHRSAPIDYDL